LGSVEPPVADEPPNSSHRPVAPQLWFISLKLVLRFWVSSGYPLIWSGGNRLALENSSIGLVWFVGESSLDRFELDLNSCVANGVRPSHVCLLPMHTSYPIASVAAGVDKERYPGMLRQVHLVDSIDAHRLHNW